MRTIWKILPQPTPAVSKNLSSYAKPIQAVLNNRGIFTEKDAEKFFSPKINDFHDPSLLYSLADAVKEIENCISRNEKIAIHGDFDVDGVTASAILLDYLKNAMGANVFAYIPHRVDEGYGLSKSSIDEIIKQGAKMIITVDCGIRDAELIEQTEKRKVKVIVTDHHELRSEKGEPYLPDATAVIHPKHPKGSYPFHELAGAGVAWKLVCALEESRIGNSLSSNTKSYLDLVALATVCDVMPLVGENRIIVKAGLKMLKKIRRQGLEALIKQSALSEKTIQAYHLGFVLGPRLNAAGRLASAMDALNLLVETREYKAIFLAEKLDQINSERQKMTTDAVEEAEGKIEKVLDSPLFYISSDKWKDGIIGLVAGRLTEKYYRPTIAVRTLGDEAKGSARSVKGYDIVGALSKMSELLTTYGGHAMAAGFTTTTSLEPKFRERLLKHASKTVSKNLLIKTLNIDYKISGDEITFELVDCLEKLEPTGFGNPTPIFALLGVEIISITPVGAQKNHLKITIKDPKTDKFFDAIWFEALPAAFSILPGTLVNLAFNLSKSVWNNAERLDLRVKSLSIA